MMCLALLPLSILHSATLTEQAEAKIAELESLITQAEAKNLDVEREKLAVWVANEFLRFADWDGSADGLADNEREFGKYGPYKGNEKAMAAALPDQEREDVIALLTTSIAEITDVIAGTVVRRDVPLVDWENITVADDELLSNGKPVFIYDYFSKSMGAATDNDTVYNHYLGDVDHPKSINNHYVNEDTTIVKWRMDELKNHPSTKFGYTMLWHKGNRTWQDDIPEIKDGNSLFMTYDIDNPHMRNYWKTTLNEAATHNKGKKFIDMGYCLANEPHWYSEEGHWTANQGEMTTISSYTLNKFHDWLAVKYDDDINKLNNAWYTFYLSFDAIAWTMPVPKTYKGSAKWYDWCRFNMDRATEWFTFLQESIHASDPNAATHLKIMTDVFAEEDRHHGIDLEAATELTTYIGDDAKARKRENKNTTPEDWEADYAYYWEELAVSYDFMESVSPNKIHVNSESHFLSTSQWRDLDMKPAYVRNVYWLATILGMDANLSWFWARNPDGSIEDRFATGAYTESSYAGSCAQQPLVVNEYAKVMMDMNAFSEEIMKLRRLDKPVRIFYSEASVINGDEQMQHYFEVYESMFFDGLPMGYATKNIIEKQDNDLWEAVVVYKTESVTDAEFDALQNYLNDGGTVIIDNGRSLIKNEHLVARTETLTKGNGTLHNLGASASLSQIRTKVNEITAARGKRPAVELTESNGTARKGCNWRVAQDTDGNYLLNILNVGKKTASISLKMRGGANITSATDMLTGKSLGASFSIPSEGVLLVKVEGVASGINDAIEASGIQLISADSQLVITGAAGEAINVYDVSGRQLLSQAVASDYETLNLPAGVVLVEVVNLGTLKAVVQ